MKKQIEYVCTKCNKVLTKEVVYNVEIENNILYYKDEDEISCEIDLNDSYDCVHCKAENSVKTKI